MFYHKHYNEKTYIKKGQVANPVMCEYVGEKPLVPQHVINDLCDYLGIRVGQTFSF